MGLMIETFGLTRKFANLTALEDLSIQVSKGEILEFLGPNGAGKTTTIRILSGIIAPTKGHAVVAGIRTDEAAESLHEVIGLLTESPGFYERLNATENLLYFAGFYDIDVDTQVDRYLKLMGLWQRRGDKLGTFSKGMKQRLALARALLHNPKVLFLDEPTAGLDPESAQEVRKLIRRLKEEGRTIFLSTHNLGEAESLCDRIGLFRTRLIALDSPKNLRNRLFQRQVVVELSSIDKELVQAVRNLSFVQQVEIEKTRLIIELKDFDKNRPELVRRIVQKEGSIQSVSEKKHSLEEIYLTLIKEEKECGI